VFDVSGNESRVDLYTEAVWAKICIKDWVIGQVDRYETKLQNDAISVDVDNILTVD